MMTSLILCNHELAIAHMSVFFHSRSMTTPAMEDADVYGDVFDAFDEETTGDAISTDDIEPATIVDTDESPNISALADISAFISDTIEKQRRATELRMARAAAAREREEKRVAEATMKLLASAAVDAAMDASTHAGVSAARVLAAGTKNTPVDTPARVRSALPTTLQITGTTALTTSAQCPRGHVHEYVTASIIAGEVAQCYTCGCAEDPQYKTITQLRMFMEQVTKMPFVIDNPVRTRCDNARIAVYVVRTTPRAWVDPATGVLNCVVNGGRYAVDMLRKQLRKQVRFALPDGRDLAASIGDDVISFTSVAASPTIVSAPMHELVIPALPPAHTPATTSRMSARDVFSAKTRPRTGVNTPRMGANTAQTPANGVAPGRGGVRAEDIVADTSSRVSAGGSRGGNESELTARLWPRSGAAETLGSFSAMVSSLH